MHKKKITYYPTAYYVCAFLVLFFFNACQQNKAVGKLTITEPKGILRDLEYVEVEVSINQPLSKNETILIRDEKNKKLIPAQILSLAKKDTILCLFPVQIEAHEVKYYEVIVANKTELTTDFKITGEGLELVVENRYYIANLTSQRATDENELGAGQLASLTLKTFENQVLQRSNMNMHWAPNFQKEGLDYKTIGHIRHFDSVLIDKGPYQITTYRSGKVDHYKEIQVEGAYQFRAGLPYFIFSSQIIMVENVVLTMLRNDEITMDSLFTHAMFPLPGGGIKIVRLYDDPPLTPHYSIKELRKNPVDANVGWFCFYNDSLKYGFGSIRLQYDYSKLDGSTSPMLNPETRITQSGKGGRYWDRRFMLVKEGHLKVPKGSRYSEKNAYVIFRIDLENPAEKIKALFNRLSHPVIVNYNQL